jgi:hypothetical protein
LDDHEKNCFVHRASLWWKGADVVAQAAKYLTEAQIYLVGGTKTMLKISNKILVQNLHIVGFVPHEKNSAVVECGGYFGFTKQRKRKNIFALYVADEII